MKRSSKSGDKTAKGKEKQKDDDDGLALLVTASSQLIDYPEINTTSTQESNSYGEVLSIFEQQSTSIKSLKAKLEHKGTRKKHYKEECQKLRKEIEERNSQWQTMINTNLELSSFIEKQGKQVNDLNEKLNTFGQSIVGVTAQIANVRARVTAILDDPNSKAVEEELRQTLART